MLGTSGEGRLLTLPLPLDRSLHCCVSNIAALAAVDISLLGGPERVLLTGSFEGKPPMLTLDLVIPAALMVLAAVVLGLMVVVLV